MCIECMYTQGGIAHYNDTCRGSSMATPTYQQLIRMLNKAGGGAVPVAELLSSKLLHRFPHIKTWSVFGDCAEDCWPRAPEGICSLVLLEAPLGS